jgi:hypothetical protein
MATAGGDISGPEAPLFSGNDILRRNYVKSENKRKKMLKSGLDTFLGRENFSLDNKGKKRGNSRPQKNKSE